MRRALALAREAFDDGEVPVGAVVVCRGEIVGEGRNRREKGKNALLHAEIDAINNACKALGGWRLPGCSAYVTCEPCSMCAGAMVWARIEDLYVGADDPKAGACGSVVNVASNPELNHEIRVHRGVLRDECAAILKDFFRKLRSRQ